MTTVYEIPRESIELVGPITATANGVAVTTFEVALLPDRQRPATANWAAPLVIGTERFVLATGLDVGVYRLWLRYAAAPETPVLHVGTVVVT